jgi:hypothetical protein
MAWRIALTALGVIHLLLGIWHGSAHARLAVALSPAQNLFVYVVILLAPLVAVILLWTRYAKFALGLFLAAMSASLVFGLLYHYLLVTPDNIHHLAGGGAASRARFTMSAAVLALVEVGSAVAAAYLLRQSTLFGS